MRVVPVLEDTLTGKAKNDMALQKKRKRPAARRPGAKKKSSSCAGVVKSGTKKGKLRPGFKWVKGHQCPVPVK